MPSAFAYLRTVLPKSFAGAFTIVTSLRLPSLLTVICEMSEQMAASSSR